MPLRMKDFGDNPTDEEKEYNQNTVEFLFQAFGVDINKQTGYPDGVEINFEHIFHQVIDYCSFTSRVCGRRRKRLSG